MRPIRALIVEGRDILRAGLDAVLRRDPAIHVLGTAGIGRRGIELLDALEPDVVLVDHVLPDMGGIEFCEMVRGRPNSTGVVVISTDGREDVVLRSLRAGARGFVHVGTCGADLAKAVKAVARGEAALDPAVAGSVMGSIRRTPVRGPALSVRETEVMRLVSGGLSDQHIAATLGVSHNTVKTYLRRSLDKLGCRTRSEAAAKVARSGLLDASRG